MAIHVHLSTDPGAPNLTVPNNGDAIIAMLYAILVTGYGSHPGYGWTVIHDSTRYTNGTPGRLILQHPSGDFVLVLDNMSAYGYVVGLADAGYSDGTTANYQTGQASQGGASQRYYCQAKEQWAAWKALYDDLSHTLIFESTGLTSRGQLSYGASSNDRGGIYIGTLATPQAARKTVPVAIMGTITSSDTSSSGNGFSGLSWTTLVQPDGAPANGDTYLCRGSTWQNLGQQVVAGIGAEPYTPLIPASVGIAYQNSVGLSSQRFYDVGCLRGVLRAGGYLASSIPHWWARNRPAVNAAAPGSRVLANTTINGVTMYAWSDENFSIGFVSTDPADWEDLS